MSLLCLPGILIMAIFFMAQGLSEDTWREHEAGTLQRAATTPQTLTAFYLGKTFASGTLITRVSALVLAIGMGYHEIGFKLFPVALTWVLFGGLVLCLVMVWFQTLASTARGGSVIQLTKILSGSSNKDAKTLISVLMRKDQGFLAARVTKRLEDSGFVVKPVKSFRYQD